MSLISMPTVVLYAVGAVMSDHNPTKRGVASRRRPAPNEDLGIVPVDAKSDNTNSH